jgi:transposase
MREEHKELRKQSLEKTRQKRKNQICKVYTTKIDESHLNRIQKEWLHKIFIEAKWFYNHTLNQDDIFNSKVRKDKNVQIKVLDKMETRKIKYLSSQMKVDLHERICSSVKILASLKKKGLKIGKLKFTGEINSIGLKQYVTTYSIIGKDRIKIQGLKKPFKVNGLNQIPENSDFANARLIRKPSGYYIQVTVFVQKPSITDDNKEEAVGLDFGIKTNMTTSDGEKFDVTVKESERLKKLQRTLFKKKKGSNSRNKIRKKITKEHERLTNRKKDKANKIVSHITKKYKKVYMQDEMISAWHKGLFGRSVQNSALGTIKSKLTSLESTVVLDRSLPTTKFCPCCGKINKLSLADRIYKCECGYEKDRDIHSAMNMLVMGKFKPHSVTEHNSTTMEEETSTDSLVDQ